MAIDGDMGMPLEKLNKGTPGSKRAIVATNEKTKELRTYPSLTASSKDFSIGISAIEDSLLTGHVAKGYRFRYKGAKQMPINKKKRPVYSFLGLDASNNNIKEWPSA